MHNGLTGQNTGGGQDLILKSSSDVKVGHNILAIAAFLTYSSFFAGINLL